jgi:hypothetical protein
MIQIHINPARIERVLFVSDSEIEEDLTFAAWQAIRLLWSRSISGSPKSLRAFRTAVPWTRVDDESGSAKRLTGSYGPATR